MRMRRPSIPQARKPRVYAFAQLAAASAVMVVGAWLVAWWAVGVVLMLLGGFWVVMVDFPDRRPVKTRTDEVLDMWRRAS